MVNLISVIANSGLVLLHFSLFFAFYLFLQTKKNVYMYIKKIEKKTYLMLLFIVLLGGFVRLNVSPFSDSIDSVGWEYMYIGDKITKLDAFYYSHPHRTLGYPLFIAMAAMIFGHDYYNIFYMNIIFGMANIAMVFFLVYIYFNNSRLALLASLFFAVYYYIVRYSAVNSANQVFFFFIFSGLIIFWIALKEKKINLILLAVILFSIIPSIRYEFYPVSIIFVAYLLFFSKARLNKKKSLLFFSLFIFLLIPAVSCSINGFEAVSSDAVFDSGKTGIKNSQILTLGRIKDNIPELISLNLLFIKYMGVLFIPAVIGLFCFFNKKNLKIYSRQMCIFTILFFMQMLVYLFSRLDYRFANFAKPPLLIIYCVFIYLGLEFLAHIANKMFRKPKKYLFSIFLLLFFIMPVSNAISYDKIVIKDSLIVSDFINLIKNTDPDTYIIVDDEYFIQRLIPFLPNTKLIFFSEASKEVIANIAAEGSEIILIRMCQLNEEGHSKIIYCTENINLDDYNAKLIRKEGRVGLYHVIG